MSSPSFKKPLGNPEPKFLSRTEKHAGKVLAALFLLPLIAAAFYLFSQQEIACYNAPSGKFTDIVSEHRYQHFLMSSPGGGSDSPGFVEIFDQTGGSFGRIPVDLVWMANDLEWTSSGAEIKLVGEWDFQNRTCCYWSEGQNRQIWVKR